MAIWIAAHGLEELLTDQVVVPDGWTVSTYADDRSVLEKVVGYQIARTGAEPDAAHTVQGNAPIPNYQLGGLTFVEALDYRTIHGPTVGLLLVGHDIPAPTRLCTGSTCSNVHEDCEGLLGRKGPLAAYADKDIRLISCLEPTIDGERLKDHALAVTSVLPGSTDPGFFEKVTQRQDDWLADMRKAAVAGREERQRILAAFEKENEEDKVLLLQRDAIRKFCYTHYAGEFLEAHNAVKFYLWIESLDRSEKEFYLAPDGACPDVWQKYYGVQGWVTTFLDEATRDGACARLPGEFRQAFAEGSIDLVRDPDTRKSLQSVQRWAAGALGEQPGAPDEDAFHFGGIYFSEDAHDGSDVDDAVEKPSGTVPRQKDPFDDDPYGSDGYGSDGYGSSQLRRRSSGSDDD
ncbi:putative adhesin [Kitasatospora mediocidica]|uniref:putative adhesin n=1 Tax=Kitasatospora mediocidica TaxID=58352 RepID=UPI000559DC4D|nr:hypothetical protein [Kitasatospora mediocidica]